MKKSIIFLSVMEIWSIEEGKGAPSFYNTLTAYDNAGYEVWVILPFSKYRKKYNAGNCRIVYFNNQIIDRLLSIPKFNFLIRPLAQLYFKIKFYNLGKKIILENQCKPIIYTFDFWSTRAGKKLSRKMDLILITRFMGTFLAGKKNNLFNRIRYYPQFGALATKADCVIMTNDGTKGDEVLKEVKNDSKLLFLRNGQNPVKTKKEQENANVEIRKKYNITNKDSILLTVSRLKNWKRVYRAIEMFSKLIEYKSNVYLIIVGDGDETENLQKLAKDLNVDQKVIFTGGLKQEEVWKYYSAADIFLSLYDISNVGNPLMEAMRHGKTIVTIDNGETGKIIKNNYNGILLNPERLNNIEKTIDKLLNDQKLSKKLSMNALEYASKEFVTWEERMNNELEEVSKIYRGTNG